jgi:hypothetical protein
MNLIRSDQGQMYADRVANAVTGLFGDQPVAQEVLRACREFERQREGIESSRGIDLLSVSLVGAKGQGKSWIARQLVKDPRVSEQLRSGDLARDATGTLTWVGPRSPEQLNPSVERFIFCQIDQMADIGRPYLLLDTPGVTDADAQIAEIARQALSLSPIKLLVIARDQVRSAINTHIARQTAGSVCIPIITMIDPKDLASADLANDIKQLLAHLQQAAPQSDWLEPIRVIDFDIAANAQEIGQQTADAIVERLRSRPLDDISLSRSKEQRLQAAQERFRVQVSRLVGDQIPQLASAVRKLYQETEKIPEEVISSMLGSPLILQAAVRSRMRTQLVNDTSGLWFPYRSVLSLLHLTHGAWDRVLMSLTGSVPSLFGALTAWARNFQQSRQLQWEMQSGLKERIEQQVRDRIEPLCEHFQRVVQRLQTRGTITSRTALADTSNVSANNPAGTSGLGIQLTGIQQLQNQSQNIFENTLAENAFSRFPLQCAGLMGTVLFWAFLAGPIISVYRQYFQASYHAIADSVATVEHFPHPSPNLFFTSLLLSTLPLLIYCMLVLTLYLRRSTIERVSALIQQRHYQTIEEMKGAGTLRLHFENPLLDQAQFLIHLEDQLRAAGVVSNPSGSLGGGIDDSP